VFALDEDSIDLRQLKIANVDDVDELVKTATRRDVNWAAIAVVKTNIYFNCICVVIFLHFLQQ
jgi:hypothetical protein